MTSSEERSGQVLAVWTALLALFSIVGFALYGLPFFYDFYIKELGWTRQQVTSGNAYSKVFVAVTFGFVAGLIIDRFGPRRIMMAGILVAGGALIGLSQVNTLPAFYLFYVGNALGYVFGGPLPNQVLLSRWFQPGVHKAGTAFLALGAAIAIVPLLARHLVGQAGLAPARATAIAVAVSVVAWAPLLLALIRRLDDKRGKAMGLAYLGIGMGGTLIPFIGNTLIEAFGWRNALALVGVLMIVIALPLAYLVREPARAAGGPVVQGSLAAALRTPAFYLLAVGSMVSIGAVGGTMQNLKLYLGDAGGRWKLAQPQIAVVLSIVLAGSLVGRVVMGWLADRWPKKYVMLLIYVIVASAIPLVVYAPSLGALHFCAFLFGIGLGGDYMIIPLMAAELFGLPILGRVMGIVITFDSVAEALMPMHVARLRDVSGSYDGGLLLLSGLATVGAVAIALLPRGAAVPLAAPAAPTTADRA